MYRNIIFFTILFIFSFAQAYTQVDLPVNLVGQKGSKLCWAACMEMVLDYYDPANTETQCTLAYRYKDLKKDIYTYLLVNNCNDICTGVCGTHDGDYCNELLTGNTNQSYVPNLPGNYDLLFSKLGYNSNEDIELLNWEQYKEEFDACRPVVFLYNVTGVNTTPINNHSVVAHGYFEDPAGNFFMIKDPWGNCLGQDYVIKSEVLNGAYYPTAPGNDSIQVNRMLSSVHHISPKNDPECKDCGKENEMPTPFQTNLSPPSNLISLIKEFRERFIGTRFGSSLKYSYLFQDQLEGHFTTPVVYLSQNYMKDSGPGKITLEEAKVDAEIFEVTYKGSNRPLISTLRCDQELGLCFVEKIGLQVNPEPREVYVSNGKKLFLTNDKAAAGQTTLSAVNYQIVRYPPYPFEFYRFQYENQYYWYPVGDNDKYYLYGPKLTNAPLAVPEDTFFKALENYSKDEYKTWDKGYRQQEKVNKKIEKGRYLKIEKYIKRNDLDGVLSSFE